MDNNTEDKVRQLVVKYKNLCKEHEKLKGQLMASRAMQKQLEEKNAELVEQLSRALLVKSMVIAEGDRAAAKKAIQSMIKEIDRCIRHLYN